jgi:polyhydroxybutyrate depolymerase
MIQAMLLLMAAQQPNVQTFNVNGVERKAIFETGAVPQAKTSAKVPVVLVFHGHGGNMRQARRSFHIHDLWPEAIVVYPDGLPTKGTYDQDGTRQGWQQNAGQEGDRDLAFVDAIMAKLHKDYQVDDSRVYAMGHSNGGRFTYLLWSKRGNLFAAYAPSGSPANLLVRSFEPRPVFHVAGEADKLVPVAGQRLTIGGLRRLLGTDASKARKEGYASYETGKGGLELATYIHPGGHEYPSEAPKLIVEFFKRHHR